MENAAEAIKMAGFTLIFVIALSVCMFTVMQSKRVSEIIVSTSDKSNYYDNLEIGESTISEKGNRIVSKYDIAPTLYRYTLEDYAVYFKDDKDELKIFEDNNCDPDVNKSISYLDLNREKDEHRTWLGNKNAIIEHVNEVIKNIYSNTDIDNFEETISNDNDKRVITYTKCLE